MQEAWDEYLIREDPQEKGKATHSGILAWKTPLTEEPGRLQFLGSKRVRYDFETEKKQKAGGPKRAGPQAQSTDFI